MNSFKLALASGIVFGASLFCLVFIARWTGLGFAWLTLWVDAYVGYDTTLIGAFIGAIYGFVDAFIGVFLISLIYNALKPNKHSKNE
ncbi:MAG: hypothetical protein ACKVOH_04690 [Chlamydiales bacterium]